MIFIYGDKVRGKDDIMIKHHGIEMVYKNLKIHRKSKKLRILTIDIIFEII